MKIYFIQLLLVGLLSSVTSAQQQGWFVLEYGLELSQHHSIVFPSIDTGFFCDGDIFDSGFLKITYDGGLNWKKIKPYSQFPHSPCFLDCKNGYLFDGNNIIRTSDAGITWSTILTETLTTTFASMDFVTPEIGFICGQDETSGRVYRTTDSGKTWENVISRRFEFPKEMKFKSNLIGYVRFDPTSLWQTMDGGNHWTQWKYLYPKTPAYFQYLKTPDLWIGTASGNSIVRWKDDGSFFEIDTLFEQIDLKNPEYIQAISFFDTVGYALTDKGKIFKSINIGRTWISQKTPKGFTYGDNIFAASTSVAYAIGYISQSHVVIKTIDGGALPIDDVGNNSSVIKHSFSIEFNLIINYANFQFDVLKEKSFLAIFDAFGRSLFREVLTAGQTSLHLDMQRFPAGIYFARLGGETVRFIKM